ncbi:hypothetical protein J3D46_003012 [Paenarthrobacter sp. A20]|nr:hypothetical protein [Paenarthrobacter sp. A20]
MVIRTRDFGQADSALGAGSLLRPDQYAGVLSGPASVDPV